MLKAADILEKKFARNWGEVSGGHGCDDLAEALARRRRLVRMCSITAFHVAALEFIDDENEAAKLANAALHRFAKHVGIDDSHASIFRWHDQHKTKTVVGRVREAAAL